MKFNKLLAKLVTTKLSTDEWCSFRGKLAKKVDKDLLQFFDRSCLHYSSEDTVSLAQTCSNEFVTRLNEQVPSKKNWAKPVLDATPLSEDIKIVIAEYVTFRFEHTVRLTPDQVSAYAQARHSSVRSVCLDGSLYNIASDILEGDSKIYYEISTPQATDRRTTSFDHEYLESEDCNVTILGVP